MVRAKQGSPRRCPGGFPFSGARPDADGHTSIARPAARKSPVVVIAHRRTSAHTVTRRPEREAPTQKTAEREHSHAPIAGPIELAYGPIDASGRRDTGSTGHGRPAGARDP